MGEFLYVPDLGIDEIVRYRVDPANATLERVGATEVGAGAGPRHLTFSPDGSRAFLINELDCSIVLFSRTADGSLYERDRIDTLPAENDIESFTADIHSHPHGRFVYGSNRGHDSIVVLDQTDDQLSLVEQVDAGGKWPRNFAIDPTGTFLLVEHQHSDSVAVFSINEADGALSKTGTTLEVPSPVCLQWLPDVE
jgi:6-phosphogluconolactonase